MALLPFALANDLWSIRFLLALFTGIGVAVISLARLMNFLLNTYPIYTWSLFFGLVAASISVVGQKVEAWSKRTFVLFMAGVAAAYFIVGLIPVSTPEELWFIFLSGLVEATRRNVVVRWLNHGC